MYLSSEDDDVSSTIWISASYTFRPLRIVSTTPVFGEHRRAQSRISVHVLHIIINDIGVIISASATPTAPLLVTSEGNETTTIGCCWLVRGAGKLHGCTRRVWFLYVVRITQYILSVLPLYR